MAFVEILEDRRLLSGGLATQINFQPARAPAPAGYFIDSGAVFGDRGGGLTYGWNGPRPAQVAAWHVHKPPVPTDTFAIMHATGRGSLWQMAVPDGSYQITVAAGSPGGPSQLQRVLVNGQMAVNGR